NQLGQKVKQLQTKTLMKRGKYQLKWDGRNGEGVKVTTGVYYLRMRIDGNILHEKLIFNK
ncbi:MAG: FlgD immunoglobulin-like domain containing protein, partial [Draconibacterium sp.]|nr:FlgD immunoglobulin-like domain containing protein [Draconibacterium sp.]